jgi:site-specific recombinase
MNLERQEWEHWLKSLPDPKDFDASLSWLKRWVNWVGRKRFIGADLSVEESFDVFLSTLREYPGLAKKYRDFLHGIFVEVRYFKLFTNAGIPSEPLLIREFILRSFRLLFPPPIQPNRASDLFRALFPTQEKAEFFREITEPQLREWISYFPRDQFTRIDLTQGIQYLSLQIAGFGTRDEIWERSSVASRKAQYFHQLTRAALTEDWAAIPAILDDLLNVLSEVESQMDEVGVSITLVFRIDRMRRQIYRHARQSEFKSGCRRRN